MVAAISVQSTKVDVVKAENKRKPVNDKSREY